MLRIGDFARIARVSVKTLRHYDSEGLLRPAQVDRATGYRYYSASQLSALNRIRVYRSLGFSLNQTRALIEESSPAWRLRELLGSRRRELVRHIALASEQLAEVTRRIAEIENQEFEARHEMVIRETEACEIISARRILPDYGALDPLLLSMRRSIPESAIRAQGAIWHRCASAGASIDCEAILILKRECAHSRTLPASTVASVAVGDSERDPFPQVYSAMKARTHAAGYEILPPVREIYHANVTEIQFPLRKLKGDSLHAAQNFQSARFA